MLLNFSTRLKERDITGGYTSFIILFFLVLFCLISAGGGSYLYDEHLNFKIDSGINEKIKMTGPFI